MKKPELINIAVGIAKEKGIINLTMFELCNRANIKINDFTIIAECNYTDFVKEIRALTPEDLVPQFTEQKRVTNKGIRKSYILNHAISIAIEKGYDKITRVDISERANVSASLVSSHFNTMNQLRRDIMRTAVKREIVEIVAQGLISKDRHALKASKELKQKSANLISAY